MPTTLDASKPAFHCDSAHACGAQGARDGGSSCLWSPSEHCYKVIPYNKHEFVTLNLVSIQSTSWRNEARKFSSVPRWARRRFGCPVGVYLCQLVVAQKIDHRALLAEGKRAGPVRERALHRPRGNWCLRSPIAVIAAERAQLPLAGSQLGLNKACDAAECALREHM